MKVAADFAERHERRRLAAERVLAQLGRTERDPERREDGVLVAAVRQRFELRHVRLRAGRPQELRAEPLARRDDELDRDALDRDAGRAVARPLEHGHDLGQALEFVQQRLRPVRAGDDREPFGGVLESPRVACHLGAKRVGDRLRQDPGAVQQQATRRSRPLGCTQRLDQLPLGLRTDSRHLLQAPSLGCLAELVERRDPERPADLDASFGADPEQATEADQLGRQAPLELDELLDVARLDEFAQPSFDSRPDSAQLPGPPGAHELRHRCGRRADHLRRAPVRPHGVVLRVGELEQSREGFESVGQSCVPSRTHVDSVLAMPTIVIPFRGEDAKQRLPQELRIELAEAMLADVLAAAGEVGRTIVADGRGQGAAVEATLSEVHETPVLVVNADLPAVTPRDLLALLGSIPPDGIVVAAAADGTTNALGLAAPGLFEPLYGPGSAERFLALAPSRLAEIPNLSDDVDTLGDLERLEPRLGPRTRAALASLRSPAQ